jgi:hypothetical protein
MGNTGNKPVRMRAFNGSDNTAAANDVQEYGENHLSYVRKRTEGPRTRADNFGKTQEGLQRAGRDRLSVPAPIPI